MFGVWRGARAAQLEARGVQEGLRPDEIFLSDKTRGPLTADAVTRIVKEAFKATHVPGSGHRLRAHFTTKHAERLWREAFENNGFRWGQTIENSVLHDIAEALGHKGVTTACRHYLDLGRTSYFGVGTETALKEMRRVVGAMAKHHRRLNRGAFAMLAEAVERLATGRQSSPKSWPT